MPCGLDNRIHPTWKGLEEAAEVFVGQAWKCHISPLPTFYWREPNCKEVWRVSSSCATREGTMNCGGQLAFLGHVQSI